jgi:hypothetical protein
MAKHTKRAKTCIVFLDASGDATDKTKQEKLLVWEKYYQDFIVSRAKVVVTKETLSNSGAHPTPPSSAILSTLLPFSMSEDVIENLNELFEESWLPRHGLRTARRIWKVQGSLIVVRYWLSPLLSLLDRIRQLRTGG